MSVEFAQIQIEPAYRKVAAAIGARIRSRTLREGAAAARRRPNSRASSASTARPCARRCASWRAAGWWSAAPGSKLHVGEPSAPRHVAAGVSDALLLHDVTVRDVWEALTILEPPIAHAAARVRTRADLEQIVAAASAFAGAADTEQAVQPPRRCCAASARPPTTRCCGWRRSRCCSCSSPRCAS